MIEETEHLSREQIIHFALNGYLSRWFTLSQAADVVGMTAFEFGHLVAAYDRLQELGEAA